MTRAGAWRVAARFAPIGFLSLGFVTIGGIFSGLSYTLDQTQEQKFPRLTKTDATERPLRTFFYNRVPKCGSRSLLGIIRTLSLRNNFTFSASDDYKNMRPPFSDMMEEMKKISRLKQPAFYNRHIHFLNFKKYGFKNPIYINLIRDPIERFQSNYNYLKYGDFASSGGKMSSGKFAMDINDCVATNSPPCQTKHLFYTGTFLCGFHPACNSPGLASADLAMKHVDEDYMFIGLTEEFDTSLRILEKMFPNYFTGATEVWSKDNHSRNKTTTRRMDILTESSKMTLRERMELEYRVYNRAKRKFENLKKKYLTT